MTNFAATLFPPGYDPAAVSLATGLVCKEKTLTKQADAEDADINTLVRRFGLDNLPNVRKVPLEVDLDEILDYRNCVELIQAAERSFAALPARARREFDNDPANMIAFLQDPANVQEAIRLGLAVELPRPSPDPDPTPPAPTP